MAQNAEAGRNIIQHLGDIFADDGLHPAAAARLRTMLGRQARYMRRNWRAGAGLAHRFRGCRRGIIIGGLGDGLDVFEHHAQLRIVHLLGTAPELDPQQSGETVLQLFYGQSLGFDGPLRNLQLIPFCFHSLGHLPQHFLQENRVCGKAIKVEPHACPYRADDLKMLQKVPVFCDFPLRNRRFGDLIMDNSLPPIQPFDQHRQLCAREPGGDTIPGPWPNELSAFKPFCIKAKP